jgi:large subunit ribosomal protein L4
VASIAIRKLDGGSAGDLALDDAVFAEKPRTHAVYEEVKRYLASLRAGTHATKTRGEVSGAGRKLWKQKGTGRARIGSIRSPIWRKGGTVHGPQPHTYDLAVPRQVRKLAMRAALSQKLRKDAVVVVDSLQLAEAKTKRMAALVKAFGWQGRTLLVDDAGNENLRLAARNLPGVKVVSPAALSVHDVVGHDRLVLTRGTAAKVVERFRP